MERLPGGAQVAGVQDGGRGEGGRFEPQAGPEAEGRPHRGAHRREHLAAAWRGGGGSSPRGAEPEEGNTAGGGKPLPGYGCTLTYMYVNLYEISDQTLPVVSKHTHVQLYLYETLIKLLPLTHPIDPRNSYR